VKKRLGILISGRGSNMKALAAATRDPAYPAEVAVIVSNIEDAAGLTWARENGFNAVALPHAGYRRDGMSVAEGRAAFDGALVQLLQAHDVDLVVMAGFMRIVTPVLLEAFPGRVLNIHPSLLPSFPGAHGHRDALAYGVKVSGCTVHFVDAGMDSGAIIAQAAVPVLDDDTEESLAARVLVEEHRLYPHAVRLVAEGRVTVTGRRTKVAP
jgi:phosphoribosylglycinamide formyltransferase 1